MDIYYVAESCVIKIPQVRQEIFPINDLVRVPHKVFQKTEFFQGQRYLFAGLHNFSFIGIQLKIADL